MATLHEIQSVSGCSAVVAICDQDEIAAGTFGNNVVYIVAANHDHNLKANGIILRKRLNGT